MADKNWEDNDIASGDRLAIAQWVDMANTIQANEAFVTAITASTAELNILDGVTATTAEINYVDGVTSNIQTQLDAKADLTGDTFTGLVTIDQNGNGIGMLIDSEATTIGNFGLEVVTGQGAYPFKAYTNSGCFFTVQSESAGNGTVWVYRDDASATTAAPLMFVEQDNAGDDQNALSVQQDGTGDGIFIDQNGNGTGLYVDAENTTAVSVFIESDALTSGQGLLVQSTAAYSGKLANFEALGASSGVVVEIENAGTGNGLLVDQNGNGIAVSILQSGNERASSFYSDSTYTVSTFGGVFDAHLSGGSSTGNAGRIRNEGTGNGLFIDQNGNGCALLIDGEQTSQNCIQVDCDTLGNASIARFETDSASFNNTSGGAVLAKVGNASATGNVLYVENVGTGRGVFVNQDGAGDGVFIDQDGNGRGLYIDNAGTSWGELIIQGGVLASSRFGFEVYSNAAQINSPLTRFYLDNASSTQNTINVVNDGTGDGLFIDQNGVGIALEIDSESTGEVTSFDGTTADNAVAYRWKIGGSTKCALWRDDSVTDDVLFQLGSSYFWTDANDDLRIKSGSAPTSDTDGITVNSQLRLNEQTGTTYTLVLGDAGKYIQCNNASPFTLTVPLNATVAYPVGTQIVVRNTGAGQVTVAATGGVTINTSQTLLLRAQHSTATLVKVATDTWDIAGDLEAA